MRARLVDRTFMERNIDYEILGVVHGTRVELD